MKPRYEVPFRKRVYRFVTGFFGSGANYSIKWHYTGDLDSNGQMCGYGTLLYEAINPELSGTAVELGYNDYTGTFHKG